MDKVYAILNNGVVENVVLAPSSSMIAEFLSIQEESIIECSDFTGNAFVGAEYREGKFVPFKYYDSWVFDEGSWGWVSPVPRPEVQDGESSAWNEETQSWIVFEIPTIEEENAN